MRTKLLLLLCVLIVNLATSQCWTHVSAGGNHTVGVKEDGTLWAWGHNELHQVGDGTTTDRRIPIQIGMDTDWQLASGGYNYSMAIKTDGTLWGWGQNFYHQLGNGNNIDVNTPQQIGTDTDWQFIATGFVHSVALKTDGTLYTIGSNSNGVLGNNNTDPYHFTPTQVGTDTDWQMISTSRGHVMALKNDGTLWVWGSNIYGQQGDGTFNNVLLPTQLGTDTDWISVSASDLESYALKTDGTLWAWGHNTWGQLGNGTTVWSTTPVQAGSDTDWHSIHTLGLAGAMAVKTDGTLWSWGNNSWGQLGHGASIIVLNQPTQVGTDNTWDFVAKGAGSHLAAITENGHLWTTGQNQKGQLGNDTTAPSYGFVELVCQSLGIDEAENLSSQISVYPNPSIGFFTVKLVSGEPEDFQYQIFDVLGRVIKSGISMFDEKISVEHFESGSYILQISLNSKNITKKLLIQ